MAIYIHKMNCLTMHAEEYDNIETALQSIDQPVSRSALRNNRYGHLTESAGN